MEYLAKPSESLSAHTQLVLRHLQQLFSLYGDHFTVREKELLELVCETHDLGKIQDIFQEIVRGKKKHLKEYCPHNFLSGVFLDLDEMKEKFTPDEVRALYTAIHYHHAREETLTDMEYKQYGEDHLRCAYKDYTHKDYPQSPFRFVRKNLLFRYGGSHALKPLSSEDAAAYRLYVLLRGILNKVDYAASAHAKWLEIESPVQENLRERILQKFGSTLREAQEFMALHREDNIVVVSPTGSGKTEGALLWLNGEKGFYTLPMKVSANAIFHRIHDENTWGGYGFSQVGLLHSDSIFEYLKAGDSEKNEEMKDDFSCYQLVRSLAMPLTVSTVDQLFKFPFKALGTELLAATLKYSKVIIDEMQMYSPKILAILLCGLEMISHMGGKFAIITATFPPFLERLMESQGIYFVSKCFTSSQQRHLVKILEDKKEFDLDAIREAGKARKVLVLCNTVINAQELKRELPEAKLLHARFTKKDRSRLEQEIQEFARSENSESGIWISTQLVEASLDIDFDELHTEMCTADSLLQRMGRCFRAREYPHSTPNVFVYDHGCCGIYDETIYDRSLDLLKNYEGRIFTETEKLEYIRAVYDESEIKKSEYYITIIENMQAIQKIVPCEYEKTDADKLFREIRQREVIPESIYLENSDTIEADICVIESSEQPLEERYRARQRLSQFTISIQVFSADSKFVDKNPISGTKDIFRTEARYDEELGLLREKDTSPFL